MPCTDIGTLEILSGTGKKSIVWRKMNTRSRIKITAKEILDLVSMKKIPLHEAVAALKMAKKELRKEAS